MKHPSLTSLLTTPKKLQIKKYYSPSKRQNPQSKKIGGLVLKKYMD
jgi:hypothetical protein